MRMQNIIAAALIFVSCSRCSEPPKHIPTGVEMPPPSGAVQYCKDNPTEENCHD